MLRGETSQAWGQVRTEAHSLKVAMADAKRSGIHGFQASCVAPAGLPGYGHGRISQPRPLGFRGTTATGPGPPTRRLSLGPAPTPPPPGSLGPRPERAPCNR